MSRSLSLSSAARLAAVAVATLILGHGAGAQTVSDDGETISTTVKTSDLDPSRDRDAQILFQRVQSAARLVCEAGEIPIQHRDRCVQASADRAIESMGDPSVADRYHRTTAETGNPPNRHGDQFAGR
jgi:UrcA family protein